MNLPSAAPSHSDSARGSVEHMGRGSRFAAPWRRVEVGRSRWVAAMPTLLFVCPDNALLSLAAESAFNARAPPRWRATSAGLRAAASFHPQLRELLADLPIPDHPPRAVDPVLLSFMRVVVLIAHDPDVPVPEFLKSRVDVDWDLRYAPDLPASDLPDVRRQMVERFAALQTLCRERTPQFLG